MGPIEAIQIFTETVSLAKTIRDSLNTLADALPSKRRDELRAAVTDLEKNLSGLQQVNLQLYKEGAALAAASRKSEKKIIALEKKLRELQAAVDLSSLYEVVDALDNTVVAKRLLNVGKPEPVHYMCASCFKNGKSQFLNPIGFVTGITDMECPACKTRVRLPNDKTQQVLTTPLQRPNLYGM